MTDIKEMVGKVFTSVKGVRGGGDVTFKELLTTGKSRGFNFSHGQDCCESVSINDICGDLDDLVGVPIITAEERTSDVAPEGADVEYSDDLEQWTFYEFATIKGSVTIRWHGTSNGYYSVDVGIGSWGY